MKKLFIHVFTCTLLTLQVWQQPLRADSLEPLMKYPTEEELRQVEELLSTLSPEELEELSKLGEELIKTAEQEGRPLFGPTPPSQGNTAPVQPTVIKQEPKPAPKPVKEELKESSIPKKQLSQLQRMLSDLVDTLGTIRQKAAADEKFSLILEPINAQLNSLAYYIRTIAYSKQVVRLTDKEFVGIKDALSKLSITLDSINNQIEVNEIAADMAPKKANKELMMQQVQSVMRQFVNVITTTCTQQHLLADLENFMKKYEPEALELRKKQEAQEKEAAGQVKKLPTTNTGITSPYLPSKPEAQQTNRPGGSQGHTGVKFGAPVNAPSGLTVKNAGQGGQSGPGGQGGQKSATKKADDKKDEKKDEKKKEDEVKDKQPTIDEQADEIRNRLISLNRRVLAGKQGIQDFFNYLQAEGTEAPAVEQRRMAQPIGDLTYEAFRIKKTMEKWAETIGKTAEWTEARAYKDDMQRAVDNSLADFQQLAASVGQLLERPEAKTNKRILSHEEELKDLQKIAKDISTVKIKPK